jgi:hypothetical protein
MDIVLHMHNCFKLNDKKMMKLYFFIKKINKKKGLNCIFFLYKGKRHQTIGKKKVSLFRLNPSKL